MYCIVYVHLGSLGGRSVGKYVPKGNGGSDVAQTNLVIKSANGLLNKMSSDQNTGDLL